MKARQAIPTCAAADTTYRSSDRLPSTAAWALGLLVGINMIFGGAALIAMALHARKPA